MFSENKKPRGLELKIVFAVYLGIAVLASFWSKVSYGSYFFSWTSTQAPSFFGILGGLVLVALYAIVSQICLRFFDWGRQLEKLLSHLLTPLSYFQILIISLLSGFVEEWLFRGVLYSHFGMFVSSIIFGLCHFFPAPKIWVWGLWSFFAGIIFCLILQISGSLILCALIHASINAVGLILMNLKAYQAPSFRSLS